MGSSIYDIREELRPFLSMNPHTIYMDWKDASDKKAQLQILLDQNAMLKREEMLDVLEDLGFKVGQLRKKPKVSEATIAFHQDEEKHAEWKEAHDNALKKPEPEKNFLDEFAESLKSKESASAPAKKPFVITQEMLDVVNELMAKKLEVTELLDRIDELSKKAASFGIIVEVPL